jgi:branched-chain amino acid transport system substrate-binding protein
VKRGLAVLAAVVALAGCGGSGKSTIRVGVLAVCQGAYAPFYDEILGGAELPLLQRGGKLAGAAPANGVRGAKVAGHPVELVIGCSDETGSRALSVARRLVEKEHVQILVGPETSAAGIAIRDYARTQPDVTFLIALSPAAEPTLQRPAPNVYRFTTDALQWAAGLGAYAYRTLGWRTAVVMGSDFQFPWAEAGAFAAEFCSLGGDVVKRVWSDAPAGVPQADGYFLSEYIPQLLVPAVKALPVRGRLAGKVLIGSASIEYARATLGPRVDGVVGGSASPVGSSEPLWTAYLAAFKQAFPKVNVLGLGVYYAIPMEAALRGLEAANGDLEGLPAALRSLRLDTPAGPVRLDAHRQAIGSNYLVQVTPAGLKPIRTLRDVDDSYAGRFSPSKPLPSRTYPPCTHGNAPRWAR